MPKRDSEGSENGILIKIITIKYLINRYLHKIIILLVALSFDCVYKKKKKTE